MVTRARPKPPKKRAPRQRTTERISFSMPIGTAARMREAAKAKGAPSLSAYLLQVVETDLQAQSFDQILDEVFRKQPMTEEERAWADEILGL